jgi:hypothetical protein
MKTLMNSPQLQSVLALLRRIRLHYVAAALAVVAAIGGWL